MRRIIGRVAAYLTLVLIGVVMLAPFGYLLLLSTKRRIEIVAQVPPQTLMRFAVLISVDVDIALTPRPFAIRNPYSIRSSVMLRLML